MYAQNAPHAGRPWQFDSYRIGQKQSPTLQITLTKIHSLDWQLEYEHREALQEKAVSSRTHPSVNSVTYSSYSFIYAKYTE